MAGLPNDMLDVLRSHARAAAARAYVPYSGRHEAVLLWLADGTWIPGVRVESASFSLLIPGLFNAFSTAAALDRRAIAAVVASRPLLPEEQAFLRTMHEGTFRQVAPDVWRADDTPAPEAVAEAVSPFLDASSPATPEAGVALAQAVARRAFIPESNFPVGCVLETDEGRLIPGVNVEHTDWTRTLCAERNALGTALSYGISTFRRLFLSCPHDPSGTPCGACRQLLAELAPEAPLWMDRGPDTPACTTPADLLPGYFSGRQLTRKTRQHSL